MREVLQKLLLLQQLQFGPGVKDTWTRAAHLRRSIPAELLAKYDRLASRGKRPVALVHNGVCGNCHIRLAVGSAFALSQTAEICQCDNCGRFLLAAEDAAVVVHPAT